MLRAWWDLLRDGQLAEHIAGEPDAVAVRASGLAVHRGPAGAADRLVQAGGRLLNPLLELFRNTAALALLPVFVLILGLGETSKIAIIVYACSWPILLNTIAGVRTVDPLLIKSARSMGLGRSGCSRR